MRHIKETQIAAFTDIPYDAKGIEGFLGLVFYLRKF